MTASFRRATAADVPVIHALLCENAANDGGNIAGAEATLLQHGFSPRPLFRAVLAEEAGSALGLSLFFPEYSSWRGQAGVFVQDLYLRPSARGRGLGRALLAATMQAAADWNPGFMTLMVQQKNRAALDFYAAQGFTLRETADWLVCEGAALDRLSQER